MAGHRQNRPRAVVTGTMRFTQCGAQILTLMAVPAGSACARHQRVGQRMQMQAGNSIGEPAARLAHGSRWAAACRSLIQRQVVRELIDEGIQRQPAGVIIGLRPQHDAAGVGLCAMADLF